MYHDIVKSFATIPIKSQWFIHKPYRFKVDTCRRYYNKKVKAIYKVLLDNFSWLISHLLIACSFSFSDLPQ